MIESIRITTPVPQKTPKNMFSITLHFEYGDADATDMEVITIPGDDQKTLIATINALQGCICHLPIASGGTSYRAVTGWEELLSDYWAHDHIYDCQATLDSFEVFYFDCHGVKYNVEY